MARSGCVYGPSGSRKTTAVKHFAHYIAERTGKATLLLSTDGGGWSPCEPEVQAGMILPYRCEVSTLPLSLLRRISQGYWPENPLEMEPARINLVRMDFERYGGLAVEGWTSIGQVLMRYLPDKGINVGGEERGKLGGFAQQMFVDSTLATEKFNSNTRGDYGFVQNFLYGFTMNCNSLPLEYVLYTALESKTEDDDRSTIYGPAIAGKKATAQAPSWVGDLLHAQDYTRQAGTQDSPTFETAVRFYFKKHPDPSTGIPFPAKPRVTPEKVGALDRKWPGGYFEPTPEHGFDDYLRTVDALAAEQAGSEALDQWRARQDAKLGRGPAKVPAAATVAK